MADSQALHAAPALDPQIERLRRFNRFYTQRIGVLDPGTDLSLATARLIFEIERLDAPVASEVARALGLDRGYVSRQLALLVDRGLIEKRRCETDGRRQILSLTDEGRAIHDRLSVRANASMAELLEPLDGAGRRRLLAAVDTVGHLLGEPSASTVRVREHGPGDLGWVLRRHGELYTEVYGFDHRFEALVAKIVGDFAFDHDPRRERLWIAEDGGQPVGSIMLVAEGDEPTDVARLRLFLVEAHARGRGVGSRLMETLLDFARRRGYRRIVLTTVSALDAARRLYERAGFTLTREVAHSDWSVSVVEEDWTLDLGSP
ncbi:MAG: bifunctional helix-turn-helix transcriptional regulator/GNAT family N-acetyltransferase [Acidobacteriota bacterium]